MKSNFIQKLTILIISFSLSLSVSAVPAKRGVKRIITLTNGSQIEALLCGDEHLHYYQDAKGNCYIANENGLYDLQSEQQMEARIQVAQAKKQQRDFVTKRKVGEIKNKAIFRGERKGLIILANFTDKKFSMDEPKALFERIANEKGYSEGNFRGSVSDYFYDNSYGKFDLTFDIVGPIELSHNLAYYGRNQNGREGNDIRPEVMIHEAILAADEEVDYKDYDWDNDGEVDQIFVIYAGYNEAQGGPANTIWPHMYALEYSGLNEVLDDVTVNTYACSSELANDRGTQVDGIGTICHEFSHCMGFPDMYDTSYKNFGMGDWSLMNSGNYNGDGFCPAAYTSYERMVCGWLEPIELTEAVNITGMKGLTDGGESYIIYGDNDTRAEYYLLENRQPISWDAELPGKGLLIMHVDYDSDIWQTNQVNRVGGDNGHQRLTIFHADNDNGGTNRTSNAGDLYPYRNNNSWTSTSVPAATQYNGTNTPKPLENREVTEITLNTDGTIDFKFHLADETHPTYQSVFLNQFATTPLSYEAGKSYNVHSNRLFKSGTWETLWLPFAVTNAQLKTIFGNNVSVAVFTGMNENGEEVLFETTDETIEANTPMLIQVNTPDTYNDMGTLIQMPFGDSELSVETNHNNFTFMGLKLKSTEKLNCFTLVDDYFFNEYNSESCQLLAFQAIMTTNSEKVRKGMKITVDGVTLNEDVDTSFINPDDDPNSIANNTLEELKNNPTIYSIDGRIIGNGINLLRTNKLPKGIYIVNGKKLII